MIKSKHSAEHGATDIRILVPKPAQLSVPSVTNRLSSQQQFLRDYKQYTKLGQCGQGTESSVTAELFPPHELAMRRDRRRICLDPVVVQLVGCGAAGEMTPRISS